MHLLSAPIVIGLLIKVISCQDKDAENVCAVHQTCTKCLQTSNCVWCSTSVAEDNIAPVVRCATRARYEREKDNWCRHSQVYHAENSAVVFEDRPLSLSKGADQVQIQPQKMYMRLGVGEERTIMLKYSQAEDYPVDLYYLMDLSASMESYRDQLSRLGVRLTEAMKKLTSNFRLGFGSFVDKVVLPMTSTQSDKIYAPCVLHRSGIGCNPPYGYKNQMPLTENVALFKNRVLEAPISGNLDAPEGGLDAMMQTMVCTNDIGWRPKARHLLVYTTDAGFHIAGDGRLAGIIEPNDCQCHLNSSGFYIYSVLQDYPSISQINKKARENKVNVIFAVPSHKYETYELLTRSISGSSIGLLDDDAENVVALVSGEYEKLVDTIVLTDDASKMVDIRYFSKCLNQSSTLRERRECGDIRLGNIVEFNIVIKAVHCPSNRSEWRQKIHIGPRGLNESLEIDLELTCDCPCDKPEYLSSPDCNKRGALYCGVCFCDEGFYGKQCECKGGEAGVPGAIEDCRANNGSVVCSGRGNCKCGVCDCAKRPNLQEIFYGKYCECDNFSCKRSNGLVCGGRGKCECGTCNCFPGWVGETCDCIETNSTCMPLDETDQVCSGRGDCICGNCHCHERDKIRYSGQYCEECPTCPGQRCEALKDCVACMAYNSGPLAKDGQCEKCLHDLYKVDVVDENPIKDFENSTTLCPTLGENGCTFLYKYAFNIKKSQSDLKVYTIWTQRQQSCPEPVNVTSVALGVVISTVLLGLLLLIFWKLFTIYQDRKEYEKFDKERVQAKWNRNDNPLYKQATSSFSNPIFRENKKSTP